MRIQGAVAVITGAGGGLGAETARMLAEIGAKVTLLDNRRDEVEAAAAACGGLGLECDVTSAEAAEAAMAKSEETHGPASILINAVGVAPAKRIVGRDGPMPLEDYVKVVGVNLIGPFNLMRLAAAQMAGREPNEDGERGVIVNTSSVAATEGQIGQAAYSSSKGGLVALTLPAARELAALGIRVNTVAPGLFATPLLLNMPTEVQDSLAATVPFPSRFGKPEEYARLVRDIVENPMINAEVIRIDGALRMQAR